MKFFLDTANIEEIKEINSWGVIEGVTTNPSLIAKEGRVFEEVIDEISKIIDGPVSAEVVSTDADGMVKEGRILSKIKENVIIKIPMTEEGLKATSILSKENIKTNVTLVFSASQAILAARAGATYVSPFLGRLDDIGVSSKALIEEISTIFRNYNIETKIIAASIRNTTHIVDSMLAGADIATVPTKVMKQMVKHPLTDSGLIKFLEDFKDVKTKEI
ncbi:MULTISPECIES: fructose-6-phosphate aldolase [Peptoniphilus]|uniref:fructose-6-phosphate aldolase n=1 Tax=Peptoniphilus TaxID=162289 RepID=UPI0003B81E9C|nr:MULTISPECIES: fructose-6-phosphate aldolase [Peptoniphilus]ERT63418.1 fructose-6-phosphate aldolase [Peptoniphilus sp. BV3AC2]MDK8275962.1 fructose-6-phosphate aldolase [Peptoniphilus duerdenii]